MNASTSGDSNLQFRDRCCNPFKKPDHKRADSLRKVSVTIASHFTLDKNIMICSLCRKQIQAELNTTLTNEMQCKICDKYTFKIVQ